VRTSREQLQAAEGKLEELEEQGGLKLREELAAAEAALRQQSAAAEATLLERLAESDAELREMADAKLRETASLRAQLEAAELSLREAPKPSAVDGPTVGVLVEGTRIQQPSKNRGPVGRISTGGFVSVRPIVCRSVGCPVGWLADAVPWIQNNRPVQNPSEPCNENHSRR
jgi:hypothetical protein